MDLLEFFTFLFLAALGTLMGGILTFKVIWPQLSSQWMKINAINQNVLYTKEFQQLRFGAYERLLLFTHRIEPEQLMLRNERTALSVQQFKQQLVAAVEEEFQHNLTQQLYVSSSAWTAVLTLKNNTLSLLRNTAQGMPAGAALDTYIAALLQHMAQMEQNPYRAVQQALKNEVSA